MRLIKKARALTVQPDGVASESVLLRVVLVHHEC